MTMINSDRRKSLFLTKLQAYLELYIFPDVYIILDPVENDDEWFRLAFSDENDEIIYDTKIQIHGTASADFEGLRDIGFAMKKDKRYIPGNLFQEIADALCMYQGIYGNNNLITIINNYIPYFIDMGDDPADYGDRLDIILTTAMDIDEGRVYLCCTKDKCLLKESLYEWVTQLYENQKKIMDIDGIWAFHSGKHLCPVYLHPDDKEKIGDVISVTKDEYANVDFSNPKELNAFIDLKYKEYMNDLQEKMEKMK